MLYNIIFLEPIMFFPCYHMTCDYYVTLTLTLVPRVETKRKEKKRKEEENKMKRKLKETWVQTF